MSDIESIPGAWRMTSDHLGGQLLMTVRAPDAHEDTWGALWSLTVGYVNAGRGAGMGETASEAMDRAAFPSEHKAQFLRRVAAIEVTES